jgi:hypothetical protein
LLKLYNKVETRLFSLDLKQLTLGFPDKVINGLANGRLRLKGGPVCGHFVKKFLELFPLEDAINRIPKTDTFLK